MAFVQQVFTVPTFTTGASISPSLEIPGCYLYVYLQVPSMSAAYSAATPVYIQASADNSTFMRFSNPEVNTSTVGANDFQIVSAATQRIVQIPNFALRYLKVELSATATTPAGAQNFKVICVSNQ